ncbi:MAG: hypothetical protein P4M11_00910 [Candidatus Pacebacteria bacterium]|nr:hypothetical protein [Candidatus Paceibacterota bacterium]
MYDNAPLPSEHCLHYVMKEIARTQTTVTLQYQLSREAVSQENAAVGANTSAVS